LAISYTQLINVPKKLESEAAEHVVKIQYSSAKKAAATSAVNVSSGSTMTTTLTLNKIII